MNQRLFPNALALLGALLALLLAGASPAAWIEAPVDIMVGLAPADARSSVSVQSALVKAQTAVAPVGEVIGQQPEIGAYRIRLKRNWSVLGAVARLQRSPGVRYAEPVRPMRALVTPNDPSYPLQYGLPRIKANEAWDVWQPQSPVILAIIDTGVQATHPDLTGMLLRDGSNNVFGFNVFNSTSNVNDDHGHGTHCAGIANGQTNNGQGIAGVVGYNPAIPNSGSFVKVMPVKALDSTGNGTDAGVATAIIWAADHGARVISMSLGGPDASTTLSNACQYAWSHGCLLVAAAGNGGASSFNYPAAYPNVISVAATTSNDTLASFSQYGSWVKIAAPGSSIFSTYPNSTYRYLSGTSMACPHVAGVAASVLAQNPTLSNSQLSDLLLAQVDPYVPLSGRSLAPAAGRVNLLKALQAAGVGGGSLDSLTVAPTGVIGGSPAVGTVNWTGTLPNGGATITLTSDAPSVAAVPASISLTGATLTGDFPIATAAVVNPVTVTITARFGPLVQSAQLTVAPEPLASLAVNPGSVAGGNSSTGTVTLSIPAPAQGATVVLQSDAGAAAVPQNVVVTAGMTTANFSIATSPVLAQTAATITASYGGSQRSAALTVQPAAIGGVSLQPNSVLGGSSVSCTVNLTGPAPPGGLTVALASGSPAANLPPSVFVQAGSSGASCMVTTVAVAANTPALITASLAGSSQQATLTVLAPVLLSFSVQPGSVAGGGSVLGSVQISQPAPPGGITVALSSSLPKVAAPPAIAVIPQGATQSFFSVDSRPQKSARVPVTLTAALNGVTQTAVLAVTR